VELLLFSYEHIKTALGADEEVSPNRHYIVLYMLFGGASPPAPKVVYMSVPSISKSSPIHPFRAKTKVYDKSHPPTIFLFNVLSGILNYLLSLPLKSEMSCSSPFILII
jgi:hypothetical protein